MQRQQKVRYVCPGLTGALIDVNVATNATVKSLIGAVKQALVEIHERPGIAKYHCILSYPDPESGELTQCIPGSQVPQQGTLDAHLTRPQVFTHNPYTWGNTAGPPGPPETEWLPRSQSITNSDEPPTPRLADAPTHKQNPQPVIFSCRLGCRKGQKLTDAASTIQHLASKEHKACLVTIESKGESGAALPLRLQCAVCHKQPIDVSSMNSKTPGLFVNPEESNDESEELLTTPGCGGLEASLCSFVLSISSTAATTANTDSHEPMRLAGDGSGSGFREEDLLLKKGGR